MSSLPEALFFVGIDWAAETHAVCVLDAAGRVHESFTIEHSAQGFAVLLRHLGKLAADRADVPAGIERPDGRLIDALLEAGHSIVPVKPNAIKTWRDGEVLCGAKSDPGDAQVIGEYLRLRARRLRPATPFLSQTKALRTVVRTRDDVVEMRVASTNQLCALLDLHWPGAKAVFADVESPIALDFLTRYPAPLSAATLGEMRIAAFCTKHGYAGRRAAAELLTRLRQAPAGNTEETVNEALREAVLALVAVVRATVTALKNLDRCVVARLGEHPEGEIFRSLPRQINAAQMLAECGDSRQAYDRPDAVAALAGLSPVTKESGEYRAVHFRWACTKRFRKAMTTFADKSRHASPWAGKTYTDVRVRARGHDNATALAADTAVAA